MYYSPLRYPGGKNKLSAFLAKVCIENKINGHYVEPYSGGASIAIFLLLENFVKKITINDKDRSIYAFWHSVLNRTEELCSMIEKTEVTIDEWKKQRKIQLNKSKADLLELGFSTFFLNRTNRSGIIKGGVMGGQKQNGEYRIHCRFNKQELIKRIKNIAERKNDIRLYMKDAIKLVEIIEKKGNKQNTIFYFDPPYYNKASTLYMNHYKDENHKSVSKKITSIKKIKWVVSYDNVPEIKRLYPGLKKKEYSFTHTAYCAKSGNEILFFSKNLIKPTLSHHNPIRFRLNRKTREIIYR